MDSSSHVCMGAATGLFVVSLAANQNIEINTSALIIYSIGANVLPDIDVFLKLKSNATYLNNHRGFTHSIFFAIIWILGLSLFAYYRSPINYRFYVSVAIIGIISHIITDLLNGYGVQLYWPFSKKWKALGITYTFDIFFIITHILSLVLIISFGLNPLVVIPILYLIISIYIIFEFILHYQLRRLLIKKYGNYKRLILQSRSRPLQWKYVYETNDKRFFMGLIIKKDIFQLRYEKRLETIDAKLEEILKKDKAVKAFIDFTPIYNYHIKHLSDGITEIKYYDLRYLMVRNGQQMYQLKCIVQVRDEQVLKSYVGFMLNADAADKKIKRIKRK